MSVLPEGYEVLVKEAVAHYWRTLDAQTKKQTTGDRGNRSAVTGGKQMDGFCALVRTIVRANGLVDASVFDRKGLQLPGYFRPTKKWDVLVVHQKHLVAAVEFKSQVGPSFGNNLNNRTEEAVGTACDIATAYREGAFGVDRPRPWVGWAMFLEDCPGSNRTVAVQEPHFKVDEQFRDATYAKRYELMLRRLVLEKCYDSAALLMATRSDAIVGNYREPAADLTTKRFLAGLGGHVQTFLASL